MASAFTHAFVAIALGKIVSGERKGWRFWVLTAGSAVLPDGDVITLGIRVAAPWESLARRVDRATSRQAV